MSSLLYDECKGEWIISQTSKELPKNITPLPALRRNKIFQPSKINIKINEQNHQTGIALGLQGYIGFQGDIGRYGYQGDQGWQGNIGYQGSNGYQGLQGDIGRYGYQGDQGWQGEVGNSGERGLVGPQGVVGFQGSVGFCDVTPSNYSDYIFWNSTNKKYEFDGEKVHIGSDSGKNNQSPYTIAIGANSGETNQEFLSVAIGYCAGNTSQKPHCVAIGASAGHTSQKQNAVSVGTFSGQTNQGGNSIAIGYFAGHEHQGENSISIGLGAGQTSQGRNSVAIGNGAGKIDQSDNSIVLNASDDSLDTSESGFFVNPVRRCLNKRKNRLIYDEKTKEITYVTEYVIVRQEGMFRISDDMNEGEGIKIVNASDGYVDVWCKGVFLLELEKRCMAEIILLEDKYDITKDDFIIFSIDSK
jgi:hypothetical protein